MTEETVPADEMVVVVRPDREDPSVWVATIDGRMAVCGAPSRSVALQWVAGSVMRTHG